MPQFHDDVNVEIGEDIALGLIAGARTFLQDLGRCGAIQYIPCSRHNPKILRVLAKCMARHRATEFRKFPQIATKCGVKRQMSNFPVCVNESQNNNCFTFVDLETQQRGDATISDSVNVAAVLSSADLSRPPISQQVLESLSKPGVNLVRASLS